MNRFGLATGVAVLLAAPLTLHAQLPLNTQTPGKATKATVQQVCAADFAPKPLSKGRITEAFAAYGMANNPGDRVIDQLIPANLGGSDDVDNLWPQPPKGQWSAESKDQLEAKLHEMVCSGKMPLKEAQKVIRENWVKAYQEYVAPAANTK